MNKYKVKNPLLGFESTTEVELIKGDGISAILQDTSDDNLKLVLLHTYYDKENDFKIPDNIKNTLELSEDSNVSVYLIVVLDKNVENSVINLCSPLIFNEDNKTMAQAQIPEEVAVQA